ncbi:MAG: TetR/AcrR family transcriptional regulator [Thermoleophilia bacterium]
MSTSPARRARGRPRSQERDDAILDAAARLLERVGYGALTMEAVATEAGVGKPTLYLRHPSKADLVAAVLARVRIESAPRPTGDMRADLVAHLAHTRRALDRVGMRLIAFCIVEEEQVPDLIAALRARDLRPGRRMVRDVLEGGRARGELPPGADVEIAIELLFGAYYARYVAGERFEEGWEERVVDAVLAAARAG